MHAPGATVPISLVNGFLGSVGTQPEIVDRHLSGSNIPRELLDRPGARVTEEQFSALYRSLAIELDDEMPGVFSRPLRSGALKFLCLSLLDAPNLETAMHRFGQFFHLVLDDFRFESRRSDLVASLIVHPGSTGAYPGVLGQELMLKLAHGIASWLIGQRIPLLQVQFAFPRPAHALEYLYLFPGPAKFGCAHTSMQFSSAYFDMPVRQRKANLRRFLARAPEDWIFVSFNEQLFSHRVREYLASRLPDVPTIEESAEGLHCSVRTLCRHLAAESTTFQVLKDELRRDIAIQRLTGSREPIAIIAGDVGFGDPTAFHRAFRHWTGSTPAAYRRGG
jgi:AraC-like DNA-binding protein